MKDITDLLSRVHEKAPAAPEPTIIRHLRDAAIEFSRRTRIWRATETVTLGTDDEEAVAVEQGAAIYEISHAVFVGTDAEAGDDGTALDPVTIDWLDREHPGWRADDEENAGKPRWITQSAPDTVRIVPKAAGTLTLELILIPSTDAEQLPDILVDSYGREIADGAIGSVLLLPAEFGNAQLGAVHAALFQGHLGRFGASVPRGQQRSPRRTRPSSFF